MYKRQSWNYVKGMSRVDAEMIDAVYDFSHAMQEGRFNEALGHVRRIERRIHAHGGLRKTRALARKMGAVVRAQRIAEFEAEDKRIVQEGGG